MQAVIDSLVRDLPPVRLALDELSSAGAENRGAIFTREEVVDFILDLVGYTTDQDLTKFTLLEPSMGEGDFLVPAIARLLETLPSPKITEKLLACLRAVEVHKASFQITRGKVIAMLLAKGFTAQQSGEIVASWLIHDDFLLCDLPHKFTHVVGNPPYLRQESVNDALLKTYRERYFTIFDRADLYVPFIQRGLDLLAQNGKLGFICSDRWMKNRYGAPLREYVHRNFHLQAYVDMVGTDAFSSQVIAYPAITVIERGGSGTTRVAKRPPIDRKAFSSLTRALLGKSTSKAVQEIPKATNGSEPWMLQPSNGLAIVRRLESMFPTLEEAGCKVGIGVATGADKIYIDDFEKLPVEDCRKLPLVTTKDIQSGTVEWQGRGVVNPFKDDGGLVDLEDFPKLRRFFKIHEKTLRLRNCAKRDDTRWYRTIDRITPSLASTPKLLVPDIKGTAHIVYEDGKLYPHHNLYFITSTSWNLVALQRVLLSGIARLFVSAYSVEMAGGFLRFQAQYLRRIRVPLWESLSEDVQALLSSPDSSLVPDRVNEVVMEIYRINRDEKNYLLKP